jgi:glycosyltransferase involved in cell wall biosynthesis
MQADLVIVEQASKLLVNYVLLALQMAGVKPLAFWGHGRTPKATQPSRIGEAAKAFMSRRVHWWFAYNDLSARYVRELGFAAERITAVQNAIDTHALAAAGAAVTEDELAALRAKLGLAGTNVCLYVGAMYREKRLPFLVAACELVKKQVPDFEVLFIGSGPDRHIVEEAVARNAWMRYLGPLFDDDKVPYFRLAKLMLMPGGVGLGILDSFALEVPMVTTAVAYQGPEIDYLQDGVNGVMVQNGGSPSAYADRVASLLADRAALERLKAGCRQSARLYSVESMARNFADGVVAALDADPLRR